jgi:hypothetical protein
LVAVAEVDVALTENELVAELQRKLDVWFFVGVF